MSDRRPGFRQLAAALRKVVLEMWAAAGAHTAMCVSLSAVLALTEGAGLLMLLPLLQLVGVVEEHPVPRFDRWIEQLLGLIGLTPTLGSMLLLFVGVAASRSLVQRWHLHMAAQVREAVTVAVRVRLYRTIAVAEWRYLTSRQAFDFAHALSSEVNVLGIAAVRLLDLCTAGLVALVYLLLAFRVAPASAGLVLVSGVALAALARASLFRSRAKSESAALSKRRLNGALAEHIASLKSAKVAGVSEHYANIIAELSARHRDATLGVVDCDADFQHRLDMATVILLAGIVYLSVVVLEVATPVLLLLLYLFGRLMPRAVAIYRNVQNLATKTFGIEALSHLERQCRDAAEPAAGPVSPPLTLRHEIGLERVSFDYIGRELAPALDGVTMRIVAGQTTAIIGASGSGKSTLADLLTGVLTPSAGRVSIDGVPLTHDGMRSWREQLGYVAQDPFFFNDSVRRNLTLDRNVNDREVWEALRLAAADIFVAELPRGLDTVVGDRGTRLSGGERQRLAIARELLRKPALLILDEATSALDPENAARIRVAIDRLHHRMTIVIISHHIDMVRHADVIHVLEGGRVMQSGAWHELHAQRHGRFAELLRMGRGSGGVP